MNFTSRIVAEPKGGTVSLTGDDLPLTGYFVGGVVAPLVVEESEVWTSETRAKIDEFIAYLNSPSVGALYLGWWTDEDTGKLWIDGTSWRRSESEAGRLGRTRRELAIFDIERQRELRLSYVEGE